MYNGFLSGLFYGLYSPVFKMAVTSKKFIIFNLVVLAVLMLKAPSKLPIVTSKFVSYFF